MEQLESKSPKYYATVGSAKRTVSNSESEKKVSNILYFQIVMQNYQKVIIPVVYVREYLLLGHFLGYSQMVLVNTVLL